MWRYLHAAAVGHVATVLRRALSGGGSPGGEAVKPTASRAAAVDADQLGELGQDVRALRRVVRAAHPWTPAALLQHSLPGRGAPRAKDLLTVLTSAAIAALAEVEIVPPDSGIGDVVPGVRS